MTVDANLSGSFASCRMAWAARGFAASLELVMGQHPARDDH